MAQRVNPNIHKLLKSHLEGQGISRSNADCENTLTVLRMYDTNSLKGMGAKGVDLSYFGNGVCKTEGKRNCTHALCTQGNGFTIPNHPYMWIGTEQATAEEVGGRWWEPGFSLLE